MNTRRLSHPTERLTRDLETGANRLTFATDTLDVPLCLANTDNVTIRPRDLARLAYAMTRNRLFFEKRHHIQSRHRHDINGSGTQSITAQACTPSGRMILSFFGAFDATRGHDHVYTADLWRDGRKDRDPAINRGPHRFDLSSGALTFADPDETLDWCATTYPTLVAQSHLLDQNCADLKDWAASGLDMVVICRDHMACQNASEVTNAQVRAYQTAVRHWPASHNVSPAPNAARMSATGSDHGFARGSCASHDAL
jgi:hypothetical protein